MYYPSSNGGKAGNILKYFTIILAASLWAAVASAQSIISVGAGSYASSPPAQSGAAGIASQSVYVVPSTNNPPIPTNKWWTDLITHQYAGNMWAYPLTVSAEAQVKAPAKPGPYRLFVYALDGHGKAAYSNISFC